MWHAITEFYLKVHAQGLSHEAAIEIMVALLGIMITVLTLFVAALSIFGYVVITRGARRSAAKIAKQTATDMMEVEIKRWQGIVMPLDQPRPAKKRKVPAAPGRKTNDAGLKRGKTNDIA